MVQVEDIDVDQIWRSLGPWGKYQWKQVASYLFICVSWVIHQLSIVFIGFRPSFKCKATQTNGTDITSIVNTSSSDNYVHLANHTRVWQVYEECVVKTYTNTTDGQTVSEAPCVNGWDYDIPKEQSFVTEWDFVCGNAELAELTQTLLIVGMMLGTFVFPTCSDRYGRKPVMVLSHVILFGIVLATAFSSNYYVFVTLRILTGAVSQGALSGTTLALETFPAEVRSYTEVLALGMWTTAICVMSPIAYALSDVSWRYLQITYALMSAWSVFQWWMLDESLRWVIANGQIERAKSIIKNACKWNKKDYDEIISKSGLEMKTTEMQQLTKSDADKIENGTSHEEIHIDVDIQNGDKAVISQDKMIVKQYTIVDIFKHPDIRRVSLIIWFTWISDSLIYYGLYMISADLYGDRYLNFFLSGIIEYPASIFEYFALNRIGRKLSVITCHAVAAVGLIMATILTYTADGNTNMMAAATAFTLVGKMGVTGAFSSAYVVTPELYPTNMRNTGLGVASFMGKVGGMIAPFFRNVSNQISWLPGCIFAVLNLITIVMFAFVPETNGIELPQTIEELTEWYKDNTFSMKIGKNAEVDKKNAKT